jgi:DNA-binding beta-propeller fold protein YncE
MWFKKSLIFIFLFTNNLFSQNLVINKFIPLEFEANDFSVNENKNFIFLTSSETNEVIKINLNGEVQKTIGGFGWGESQFDFPSSIVSTAIEVYVSDFNNHRIQRFDYNLNFVSTLTSSEQIKFEYPKSISLSTKGDLYILDSRNKRILKINGFNRLERVFENYASGKTILINPEKIKVDNSQNLFVLDDNNFHIFDQFGNYLKTINLKDKFDERIIDFYPESLDIYFITRTKVYRLSDGEIKIIFELSKNENTELKSLEKKFEKIYLLTSEGILICKEEN